MLEQDFRKRCKRYNVPGHGHYLTFSCYRRRSLLNLDGVYMNLAKSLSKACIRYDVALRAYVFMPEHVHLLVWPRQKEYSISKFLLAVKQPVARWVLRYHKQHQTRSLEQMATGQSKRPYQFWQAGGGYDRNIVSRDEALDVMNYIHLNPVRRKLVERPKDWCYCSYKDWEMDEAGPIEIDRRGFLG
jgi:putative transposase